MRNSRNLAGRATAMFLAMLLLSTGFVSAGSYAAGNYNARITALAPYLNDMAKNEGVSQDTIQNGIFQWNGMLTAHGQGYGLLLGSAGMFFRTSGNEPDSARIYIVDYAGDAKIHAAGDPQMVTSSGSPQITIVSGSNYALSVSGTDVGVLVTGDWKGDMTAIGKGQAWFSGFAYEVWDGSGGQTIGVSVYSDKTYYTYPGLAGISVKNTGNTVIYYGDKCWPGAAFTFQKYENGVWTDIKGGEVGCSPSNPGPYKLAPGETTGIVFGFNGYGADGTYGYMGDGAYRARFAYALGPDVGELLYSYSNDFKVTSSQTQPEKISVWSDSKEYTYPGEAKIAAQNSGSTTVYYYDNGCTSPFGYEKLVDGKWVRQPVNLCINSGPRPGTIVVPSPLKLAPGESTSDAFDFNGVNGYLGDGTYRASFTYYTKYVPGGVVDSQEMGRYKATVYGNEFSVKKGSVPPQPVPSIVVDSDRNGYVYPTTAQITVANKGDASVYYKSGYGNPVSYQKLENGVWVDVAIPVYYPTLEKQEIAVGGSSAVSIAKPAIYPYYPSEVELAPGASLTSSFDFNGFEGYVGDGTYRAVFTYQLYGGIYKCGPASDTIMKCVPEQMKAYSEQFTVKSKAMPEPVENIAVSSDKSGYYYPENAAITVSNKGSATVYYESGCGGVAIKYQKLENGGWVDIPSPSCMVVNQQETNSATGVVENVKAEKIAVDKAIRPTGSRLKLAPGASINFYFNFQGENCKLVYATGQEKNENAQVTGIISPCVYGYLGDGTYRAVFVHHAGQYTKDLRQAYSEPFSVKGKYVPPEQPVYPIEQPTSPEQPAYPEEVVQPGVVEYEQHSDVADQATNQAKEKAFSWSEIIRMFEVIRSKR